MSMIAATVVLLPEPVGPVITTRPRMASAHEGMTVGSPSSETSGARGTTRKTKEAVPRWRKAETR